MSEEWGQFPVAIFSRHVFRVRAFRASKPLTAAQLRRLPSALREILDGLYDSAAFLERLWALEDTRA